MRKASIAVYCLLVPLALRAQPLPESPRAFVQSFYDWYASKAHTTKVAPWTIALDDRSDSFTAGLAKALREDADAQAKAEGDIVGLDFDPFLYTQDPAKHYRVGKIVQKGNSYAVDVSTGVTAEVTRIDGRWIFVNFRYSDGDDLMSILKTLKESRSKP